MSRDDERRAEEVLAPVPEHERFRRLEELQEEQQPGRRGWGPLRHRDEPSGEELNEVED